MKRLATLVLVLAAAQVASASSWFPNRSTDSLTYLNVRYGGESTATVDSTSGSWQHWTQFAGLGAMWVWTSSTSEQVWIWTSGQSVLFADLSASSGTSWALAGLPMYTRSRISSRGAVVRTPAGTFKNCVVVDLDTTAVDAGVGGIAFAPGVGVVQWYSQSIAGPVRTVFERGTINGLAYPRPAVAGLKVYSWTDQYTYWIDGFNQPGGATKLTASITVTNSTAAAVTFSFRNGQRYDIDVVNDAGAVVARWSNGRPFTRNLGSVTLNPGQSVTYSGTVSLVNDAGQYLPAGTYKVQVYLTAGNRVGSSFNVQLNVAQ